MSNRINPVDQGLLGKIGEKIGDSGKTEKLVSGESSRGKEVAQKTATSDTVELTSSAKLLERLEKTLAASPDISASRIDAVKAQIENGEYQIDVDKIADALLRTDRELGD